MRARVLFPRRPAAWTYNPARPEEAVGRLEGQRESSPNQPANADTSLSARRDPAILRADQQVAADAHPEVRDHPQHVERVDRAERQHRPVPRPSRGIGKREAVACHRVQGECVVESEGRAQFDLDA